MTQNAVGVTTDVRYDAMGRKKKESLPYCDNSQKCDPVVQEAWTEYTYDALDRVTEKKNPDGTAIQYKHDGLKVTITDEHGHQTEQFWAAVGGPAQARLDSVKEPSGENGAQQETKYFYDALDTLTKVQLPGGLEHAWNYDSATHLLGSESHPESGATQYGYWPDTRLLMTRTDANAHATSFSYDGSDRVTAVSTTNGSTSITYDDWGNRETVNRHTVYGPSETLDVNTTYDYHEDGVRLKSRQDVIDNQAFTTTFGMFDERDNAQQVTYPSGRQLTYAYDAANRILTVHQPGVVTYASNVKYYPFGPIYSFTHGNGVEDKVTYDSRQRPAAVDLGQLLNLQYDYWPDSNVQHINETSRAGRSQTFDHDGVGRLWKADGVWGHIEYTYDALGNRVRKTEPAETNYGYVSNRLKTVNGADTFGYDANGKAMSRRLLKFGGGSVTTTRLGDRPLR